MDTPAAALPPRRYPVEEILSLRSSLPVVNCAVEKLNKHPDIAEIFRIPEEALNDPDSYCCQSRALVDATNQCKNLPLGSRQIDTSTDKNDEQINTSSKLSSCTRSHQWHLRRRDVSNRSSEPLPAPSGLASQQSENFQRFYRAVVSPTHVRVTAGGRIVPNTRATVPPQFNWNPEKCLFEPSRPFADVDLSTTQAQDPWVPHISQPVLTSPLPPVSSPNYSYPPHSASLAQATMASQSSISLLPSSEKGKSATNTATEPLQTSTVQQPIKISPPSQFDHSRPFMFNGQLVYPVPTGFQPPPNSVPLPLAVLGDPNLPHQIPSIGNFPPPAFPLPVPVGSFASPFMMPQNPAGHFPMMLPNGIPSLDGNIHTSSYIPQPIPGMISLSELTKFQIQGLRNQVKHIDNQIASHQQQVDDSFLQRQRNELLSFIEKMESMLQSQMGQESNFLSVASINSSIKGNGSASSDGSSTKTLTSGHRAEGEKYHDSTDRSELSMPLPCFVSKEQLEKGGSKVASPAVVPPIPLFVPSSQPSIMQTETEELSNQISPLDSKPAVKSEPAIKSRLTAAAAKAPPFQPRAHTLVRRSESDPASDASIQAPTGSGSSSICRDDQALQYSRTINSRCEVNSSSQSGQFPSGSGLVTLSRAHTMQSPQSLEKIHSGLLQRSKTFHVEPDIQNVATSDVISNAPLIPHNAVPYLVGSLPAGMHISEVHGSDIKYSRPLTDEEVRARHLYWGEAPRSAMKGSGLPKFDGKDFYPPSPTKQLAVPATCKVALPDFEHIFDQHGRLGYQTPPSQVRANSEQKLMFSPTQMVLESGIIGYQSPSPRPATYTFENRLSTEWSSTKYGDPKPSAQKVNTQSVTNHVANGFTTLFTSPTAPCQRQTSQVHLGRDTSQPATPNNKAASVSDSGDEDETGTLDSWGAPKAVAKYAEEDDGVTSNKTSADDSSSIVSTIEICLTSKDTEVSPKRGYGKSYAERMKTIQGDQHTVFLRDMLRNAATKSAPTLPGALSSATAQGYLPQYRGSAAASLAPAMLTTNSLEHDEEAAIRNAMHAKTAVDNAIKATMASVVPLKAENFLPENRPAKRDRPHRPILASLETMGAEGYMRYLSEKAENDQKTFEQGWNSRTTGKGPVMGSEW